MMRDATRIRYSAGLAASRMRRDTSTGVHCRRSRMENVMGNRFGQHAVVIGGSLAGLMTARVLADHFDAVTILERDHIDAQPGLHKSIPQGNHLHGLLLGGQQVMTWP